MKTIKTGALLIPFGVAACDQGPEFTAEDMMAKEREFAQYSLDHGYYEAFAKFLADDAVAINPDRQPTVGLPAILSYMEGGGGELSWYPLAADVSKSGDMGYTWGRYTFTSTTPEGETVVSHGKYMSVWKKQRDGTWKVVLDGGSGNPPPEE